mmetsp:Transcript_353/g.927  ORF Transcript_353/g.927 Transcript_353/m.927 type:complete len:163 (-) Transcript_353:147-635(-)
MFRLRHVVQKERPLQGLCLGGGMGTALRRQGRRPELRLVLLPRGLRDDVLRFDLLVQERRPLQGLLLGLDQARDALQRQGRGPCPCPGRLLLGLRRRPPHPLLEVYSPKPRPVEAPVVERSRRREAHVASFTCASRGRRFAPPPFSPSLPPPPAPDTENDFS